LKQTRNRIKKMIIKTIGMITAQIKVNKL
jgi:hypothetical protein